MRTGALLTRQAWLEQRAFWRSPEYAFFTLALPIALLLVLGASESGDHIEEQGISALTLFVPSILAFGIIAAAYANLATRLAVLRSDGVLKRIRATPLPPRLYLGGHLASTLATTLLVAFVTLLLGELVFDIAPRLERTFVLVAATTLGIVCFASLALAVSVAIPSADAAAPITNATYLPLALISGVFDPTLDLPAWLTRAADLFPVKPLVDSLRAAYHPGIEATPTNEFLVLAAWTALGITLALHYFRWEP